MNAKEKILDYLAPYRDKTLSFGCEIRYKNGDTDIAISEVDCDGFHTVSGSYPMVDDIEIIGHQLTPMDLLRVIFKTVDTQYLEIGMCAEDIVIYRLEMPNDENIIKIKLPLTYPHLTDIPDGLVMWEKLLPVFNLK